ncbi:hypothetical protein [Streptomyces sp. NPDC047079]|uniref:carboxymuconolactone decarboxylase family protein n=1 Tax=Streptomyces sp. NPDC047079 TaxID=3154607 RepID=UPI0033F4775F
MSGDFIRRRLRAGSFAQVRYVTPIRYPEARGVVADVYRGVEHDFGVLAPPILLHAPCPDLLAASWVMMREALLASRRASRSVKEAVATAVSVSNTCPFCVTVHSATLHGLIRGRSAAAVAADRPGSVDDSRLQDVATWAMGAAGTLCARTGGGAEPPFPPEQTCELVAVATLFHYLNRMVNIFLGSAPLPPRVPGKALRPVAALLSSLIRAAAPAVGDPGESLDLLPSAPLPPDMAWALGDDVVAQAFARAAAAADLAGEASVPPRVQELVRQLVDASDGLPSADGRAAVEAAVQTLSERERDVGRLALLTALASYQVEESVVGWFRERQGSDAALIEVTAWASMVAARREAGRLWAGACAARCEYRRA